MTRQLRQVIGTSPLTSSMWSGARAPSVALRLTAQPELAHNVFACLRPEHQASLSVLEAVSGSVRAICVRHHWVAIATFTSQPGTLRRGQVESNHQAQHYQRKCPAWPKYPLIRESMVGSLSSKNVPDPGVTQRRSDGQDLPASS